ncbi:MAG: ABC transporter permease [Lachnospiraceae bacterium]|nr:ABC transporter permease [Lachnospiraceae bacterium]MBP5249767.1 ABC transporter permease [Lachnospiraceae bacterium]
MKTNNVRKILLGFALPVVIVILWWYVTTYGSIPVGILPDIPRVGSTFKQMLESGQLLEDLKVSISRVLKGYALAAATGIVLGSLIGMFHPVRELLLPMITVIRQIPIIAWIPLIILWAGIGESSKVIIIVLAAFFPVLVNTESGISGTPAGFLEVAKLYGLNPWKTFTKVYLPHALPNMLVGLRLGLGVSWMAVVAAELIAAASGVGYRMSNARSMMRSDIVIVCMIVIGLVGVLMDKLIGLLFSLITPWKKHETKR